MKLKEMIEIIQDANLGVSDQRIIKLLNQANIEFSSDTRISEASYVVQDGTVANKTYYTIADGILTIQDVYIDGERANRLAFKPGKEDPDFT